jgi:hypothetical protein
MPFLEIKQSGPDVPDGSYPMILVDIKGDPENPSAPRHVVPESGPNAGKDLYFWDWTFRINIPGEHPLNEQPPFEYGTSTATGPRSKMFGVLTALLNGARPTIGQTFEKDDFIGRQVYATVQKDEVGYCRIIGLSPVPAHLQQQAFAQATGAPTQGTPVAPLAPQQIIPTQQQAGGFGVAGPQPPAVVPATTPAGDLPF